VASQLRPCITFNVCYYQCSVSGGYFFLFGKKKEIFKKGRKRSEEQQVHINKLVNFGMPLASRQHR
jgi:hypothetical protein